MMVKLVSATEFKAKCLKLIDDMQRDGQPVTITRHGRIVAELTPRTDADARPPKSIFGMLESDRYRFDMDPSEPAADPDDWDALR